MAQTKTKIPHFFQALLDITVWNTYKLCYPSIRYNNIPTYAAEFPIYQMEEKGITEQTPSVQTIFDGRETIFFRYSPLSLTYLYIVHVVVTQFCKYL